MLKKKSNKKRYLLKFFEIEMCCAVLFYIRHQWEGRAVRHAITVQRQNILNWNWEQSIYIYTQILADENFFFWWLFYRYFQNERNDINEKLFDISFIDSPAS